MKRWLVRIFVFLLLGAIVNVAVAWAAASAAPHGDLDMVIWHEGPIQYYAYPQRSATFQSVPFYRAGVVDGPEPVLSSPDASLPIWSYARQPWCWPDTPVQWHARDNAAGWPLLALRCRWSGEEPGTSLNPPAPEFGIALPSMPVPGNPRVIPRALPLRPIWPGFAINTVFYAVVLWLLFAGPFVLRRWQRIRRGLCPKCAYDLRGTPEGATACPECGQAVAS